MRRGGPPGILGELQLVWPILSGLIDLLISARVLRRHSCQHP